MARTFRNPEQLLAGLDDQQREVALTFGRPLVVLAGAGTGKTRALTHRIAYAIATKRYQANATLALTFTTRAAGELAARLNNLGLPSVSARTFHSAALRQLKYFWPKVEQRELPQLQPKNLGLIASAAANHGIDQETSLLRDIAGEISWAKVSNVTIEQYPYLAVKANRELAGIDVEQIAAIFASYEQLKKRLSVIDFDDILLCTVALLYEHPEIAEQIQDGYRYFTVDEFQDVSPLQQALLEQWVGQRNELCIVGDPDQAIHAFAGADVSLLTGFAKRHPESAVLYLNHNYRCSPPIVRSANALMANQPNRRPLTAIQTGGEQVILSAASDQTSEAASVAQWITTLHNKNAVPYSQIAVLFRINAQSAIFEAALSEAQIPYIVRDGENFYDRPEVGKVLNYLRTQNEDSESVEALRGFERILQKAGWNKTPPEGRGNIRARWESLQALRDLAQQIYDSHTDFSLADITAEILDRSSRKQVPSAQAVTLSTMHSAKGLEWQAVAVVGVHEGIMPISLAKTPTEIAEERRLLYVALTRAVKWLRISWSKSSRSRFLDALVENTNGSSTRLTRSSKAINSGKRRNAVCYICGKALAGGEQIKLGRHLECQSSFDEELLEQLKIWRKTVSEEISMPAFVVFTDKTLQAIAERQPRNAQELIQLPGIGNSKIEKYSHAVLQIVNEYSPKHRNQINKG